MATQRETLSLTKLLQGTHAVPERRHDTAHCCVNGNSQCTSHYGSQPVPRGALRARTDFSQECATSQSQSSFPLSQSFFPSQTEGLHTPQPGGQKYNAYSQVLLQSAKKILAVSQEKAKQDSENIERILRPIADVVRETKELVTNQNAESVARCEKLADEMKNVKDVTSKTEKNFLSFQKEMREVLHTMKSDIKRLETEFLANRRQTPANETCKWLSSLHQILDDGYGCSEDTSDTNGNPHDLQQALHMLQHVRAKRRRRTLE